MQLSSRPLPFKVVKPKKASTLIAEQILRLVDSGKLANGRRLPAERRLAQQFGVNRQAVREALSALQLLGVVETRAGSGTVVASRASRHRNLRAEIRHLDEQDNPFEVMEARDIVEPEIVRLAAVRARPQQLEWLQKVIDEEEVAVREGRMPPPGDLKVHVALAHASGNEVLARFMESLDSSADQWLWRLRREQERQQKQPSSCLGHHRQILEAIKSGDAATAVRIMRMHLRATHDMLMGHRENKRSRPTSTRNRAAAKRPR